MNKDKQKKLESIAHKVISSYFAEYLKEIESDFWLINIVKIKISSDLSYLDIFVSSFKNSDILCKTLANYAQDITKALNKEIKIYKMPKVRFRYDNSWEISQNIIQTINNLQN